MINQMFADIREHIRMIYPENFKTKNEDAQFLIYWAYRPSNYGVAIDILFVLDGLEQLSALLKKTCVEHWGETISLCKLYTRIMEWSQRGKPHDYTIVALDGNKYTGCIPTKWDDQDFLHFRTGAQGHLRLKTERVLVDYHEMTIIPTEYYLLD